MEYGKEIPGAYGERYHYWRNDNQGCEVFIERGKLPTAMVFIPERKIPLRINIKKVEAARQFDMENCTHTDEIFLGGREII